MHCTNVILVFQMQGVERLILGLWKGIICCGSQACKVKNLFQGLFVEKREKGVNNQLGCVVAYVNLVVALGLSDRDMNFEVCVFEVETDHINSGTRAGFRTS
eukprot:TRINITY_DN6061_c0_g1_i2.p3 TRINITY_DN6061_c0_g1~~TRINITY_DN6061_c0_g1_i2.p3  ORF type:complete len:102 (+),score=3.52 TRINITY_DN6061_c0_g1_i2:275-580(+)